jgi:hypothetical protein
MPNDTQDNLRILHRNLLREGYQIPVDYNKFQMDMRDEGNLKSLWTNLKSEQYDLPEFDKFKKDMGHQEGMPPLIKGSVEQYALGDVFKKTKEDASQAIDRSIDLFNRAYNLNPNSPQSKSKRKQYEEGLANGDYSVITGPSGRLKLARKATAGEAYINTLKNSTNSYKESKNLKDMSDDAAIKYIEDKFSKEDVMPTYSEGVLSKITEGVGGLVRLAAKQGTGALIAESAAGLLAPETGGLSLAALAAMGGIVGAGDELSTQEYGSNLMKYYMQGKAEGLNPKDAIQKARTQASRASKIGYAEAVGYELAGKAAGRLLPKNVTGEGVKAAVGKYLMQAAPEVIGAGAVAGGSSLAKDVSAKELGYKVSNKEMFNNAWDEASDIGKFMLASTALHGAVNGAIKVPNYVKSQLKNFVASAEEGLGERVLNNLKDAGVLKAADVEKTLGSLNDFKKAAKDIKPLNVEDETVQGSLAGKQEKKNKIKKEIDELNKNGVSVGINDKQAQIEKIDKEMEAIHQTGDVDKHEHDEDFGVNARVEENKEGKKLFIDDVEVTPEEFEYVTGKKPEDYPAETIEEAKTTEEKKGNIKFKTSEGEDMYGKRLDIPGHEDFHIMLVDGENGPEVWEQSIGRKLDVELKSATPIEEIPNEIAKYLDKNKLTSDWLYNQIDKAENIGKYTPGEQKFKLANETEGYKKYQEKKQAEAESKPFVYQGEERAKLEKLKEEALANGEESIANNYDFHLNAREGTAYGKRTIEDIEKSAEFTRKRDKELSIRENARKEKVALPEEMMPKKQEGTPEELEKSLSQFYKKPSTEKVSPTLKAALEEAYAKSSAIVNKYGYYPNDYLDSVKFNPEMALARLVRTLNGRNLEKKAERVASAEAEVYEIAKQIDEYAKKEGIDLGTSAIEEHETEAHKQALSETVKGTEYENQARSTGLRTEPTEGAAGEVQPEPTKQVEPKQEGEYTHTDAGFESDADARAAYEQRGDSDVKQTYEEFLYSKACGDF